MADPVAQKAQAALAKSGKTLQGAFNWTVSNISYVVLSSMGTNNLDWYANYGFTNHSGHCYVYACVFAKMARELGYEARVIDGDIARSGGRSWHHSWAEVKVNGVWYNYDPEYRYECLRKGRSITTYQFVYGQSNTLVYKRYRVLPG